jgi:sulfotransferase 6B1
MRTRARLSPPGATSPIFVNSFPKSGTHVVLAVLERIRMVRNSGVYVTNADVLPDASRPGGHMLDPRQRKHLVRVPPAHYVTAHLWARAEIFELLAGLGFRSVFVIRDPRDTVVSTALYLARMRKGRHYRRFRGMPSDQARLIATIRGFPGDEQGPAMEPLSARLRGYGGWLDQPDCLTCRFEELIGESGGGSRGRQLESVTRLLEHIGVELTPEETERAASGAFSTRSATFRSGRIGEWQTFFDESVAAAFADEVPDELMAAYGYRPATGHG